MAQISNPSIPLISALPQFNPGNAVPDDLAAASPILQSLLSQTGGNLSNVDALGASNSKTGSLLSLLGPAGGLDPAQAAQFGPMFGLLMSLMGGTGGQTPQQPQGGLL